MLVGLHGKKGSGKDTFLNRYIAMYPNRPAERLAFADKVKEFIALQMDVDLQDFESLLKRPELGAIVRLYIPAVDSDDTDSIMRTHTVREWIQRTATEAAQEVFGKEVWVDLALPRPDQIDWPLKYPDNVAIRIQDRQRCPWHEDRGIFITDVRFVPEAARIRELCGKIVRIIGPDDSEDPHLSEQLLPDDLIDFTVDNTFRDDDFEYLDKQIEMLANPPTYIGVDPATMEHVISQFGEGLDQSPILVLPPDLEVS